MSPLQCKWRHYVFHSTLYSRGISPKSFWATLEIDLVSCGIVTVLWGTGKMLLRIYWISSTLLNRIKEDITSLIMIWLFDFFLKGFTFCLTFIFLKMFVVPGSLETMIPVMKMVSLKFKILDKLIFGYRLCVKSTKHLTMIPLPLL